MKNWNSPEIQVLDINETANGFFPCEDEWCIWTHPSCPPSTPSQPEPGVEDPKGPGETTDPVDPTEQFS